MRESAARSERDAVTLPRRLLVLLAVVALVLTGGWWAYRHQPEIRAQAHDYLAYRRVVRHADVLAAASRESGVDPYLLAALMCAESSGRVSAVSKAGAMGLFQLSSTTAKWRAEVMGLPEPTREQLLTDPLLNARLGANNIAWLLRTYDGDELRALCAYNAGARRLKILSQEVGGWEAWRAQGEATGTSQILLYAQKVLRDRDRFRERGLFAGMETAETPAREPGETPPAAPSGTRVEPGASSAPAPTGAGPAELEPKAVEADAYEPQRKRESSVGGAGGRSAG